MNGQQYQPGDFQRSGPQMQRQGVGEALAGAFDTQQPWSLGGALSAMMMGIPGTSRPTATIPNKPMFRANNYMEPNPAANGIKPFEHERFRRQLEQLLPITPKNEAQALALQKQMRKVDAMPRNEYWGDGPTAAPPKPNPLTTDLDQLYGQISPQERARILGIKLVD